MQPAAAIARAISKGSMDLQRCVDGVLVNSHAAPEDLNVLMCTLLDAHETAAFIRIWDIAQARRLEISTSVRAAMERLHKCGKGRVPEGTLKLPEIGGARLKASRRLHKIVMGPIRGNK